jgi:uncharacterized protein (DUF433 family)
MITFPLAPMTLPLRVDDLGVVRIGATRVTLDTFVGSYRDGSTAEEIVQQFPSWPLTDVHAAIAFYLTHTFEVESYLRQRQSDAAETRRQVEQVCDQSGLRERLLARQAARKTEA